MIISRKYKYLFITHPNTASSSISKELCENYSGQPILRKHSNYFEFERIVRKEKEKKYFVFAGVRNPLDIFVSFYVKYLYNYKSIFTNEKFLLKKNWYISKRALKLFNFVQAGSNFNAFFKKINPIFRPYTDNVNINKAHCDYIIRFERLNEDFSKVLKLLKISQIRPLPNINKTSNKKNYINYYDNDIIEYATKIFGPFMLEWGYKFPKSWHNKTRVSCFDQKKYELYNKIYYYYFKYIESGFLKCSRFLRDIFG